MCSHAMVSAGEVRGRNVYRVYFSRRDRENRSHVGYAEIEVTRLHEVLRYCERPVLGLGAFECFDDNRSKLRYFTQTRYEDREGSPQPAVAAEPEKATS